LTRLLKDAAAGKDEGVRLMLKARSKGAVDMGCHSILLFSAAKGLDILI
jgi:hypothetical protein